MGLISAHMELVEADMETVLGIALHWEYTAKVQVSSVLGMDKEKDAVVVEAHTEGLMIRHRVHVSSQEKAAH